MKQLTAMIAKMGDLNGAADVAHAASIADHNNNDGDGDNNEGEGVVSGEKRSEEGELRPVIKAIGTNVSDLVEVLCGVSNAPLFLKFGTDDTTDTNANEGGSENDGSSDNGKDEDEEMNTTTDTVNNTNTKSEESSNNNTSTPKTINASQEAGGLSTLVLHCSTNLPLQTPSYAALTLGVDVKAPQETHGGFAKRCVELGLRTLGRDLDLALECHVVKSNENGGTANSTNNDKSEENDTSMLSEEEQVSILKSKEDERCSAESYGGVGMGRN